MHTPYDGSSKPFTIGLKPLDLKDWIEVDDLLPLYLDEKQRLTSEQYANIVVSEAGSVAAQHEVLNLLYNHVCTRFPESYVFQDNHLHIIPANRWVDLKPTATPPIHVAASLVQEDLVLMHKDGNGWRLVAASLCFPSAWNLREKFGKPMHDIHSPVPGFGSGTRNATLIERMFDNLRIDQPVVRWNWSLYGDDRLYHPESGNEGKRRFGDNADPENIMLRLERQTLRKLQSSQNILFTIRIFIDPLLTLKTHPEGSMLALSILNQIDALCDQEINYKGLKEERGTLLRRLSELAGLPT